MPELKKDPGTESIEREEEKEGGEKL